MDTKCHYTEAELDAAASSSADIDDDATDRECNERYKWRMAAMNRQDRRAARNEKPKAGKRKAAFSYHPKILQCTAYKKHEMRRKDAKSKKRRGKPC